ncbi:hypothetical protein ACJVC5_14655 [Peredibacter sp. HCB2-198]|uniref:hypothetical protein n=1 Tax=Peredibacter sp. HCB2-198 TaxID=3383025 RepID=UPI0038B68793
MTKKNESGKSRMIKGSLLYLWEEMKTMNMTKFKALYRIGTGYLRMKIATMRRPAVGHYREESTHV